MISPEAQVRQPQFELLALNRSSRYALRLPLFVGRLDLMSTAFRLVLAPCVKLVEPGWDARCRVSNQYDGLIAKGLMFLPVLVAPRPVRFGSDHICFAWTHRQPPLLAAMHPCKPIQSNHQSALR